jgi:hypothetical protein
MQGGKNEVSGFGGGDGNAHGFGISHLANDKNVGRLAQCRTKGRGEVGRINSDFDLFDHAAHMGVLVLKRILNGDDVPRFTAIDFIYQGSDGG